MAVEYGECSASTMEITTGVYKKLNNDRVSWSEKLQLAQHAWHLAECWIPNKQQVLLDWLCQILISKNKTKRSIISVEEVTKAWLCLLDFLQSEEINEPVGILALKPQLLQIFAECLSLQGYRRIEGYRTLLPTMSRCCWLVLSNNQLSNSFLAKLEAYVQYLSALLSLFVACGDPLHVTRSEDFLKLVKTSLLQFLSLQRKQANQRKVFLSTCEHLLEPLLRFRYDLKLEEKDESSIGGVEKNGIAELRKLAESVMAAALFHRDHMDEYQLALKVFREEREAVGGDEPARKKPRLANYVKQLFATLEALTESKDKESHETTTLRKAVLSAFPFLYQGFLWSSRNAKAVPPVVEFDYFHVLCLMMRIPGITDSSAVRPKDCQLHYTTVLPFLRQVLSSVFQFDVYQVLEDNASGASQYQWFSHLAQFLLQNDISPATFECLEILSNLNHQIIERHLKRLWTLLWDGEQSQEECGELASAFNKLLSSLLLTYSKLRQIDRFLKEGLDALRSSKCVTVSNFPRQFLDRLVELTQRIPCKQVIGLLQLLLDELCGFYVPALVSSLAKKSILRTLLCELHYISVLLNVLLSNTTFGGIVDHYTTTQTVEKLEELMETSFTKVLGPLLSLCPQMGDKKLIKLSCHSTLILFHTLEELAVYLEKCKIFKVPLIVHHQPSITWSDAVECFLPHESWGDIADLLTEEGPLRYLMELIAVQKMRTEFSSRSESPDLPKLADYVCQMTNTVSLFRSSWNGQLQSVTEESYVVAHWHLITCHFSLLFPRCSQGQQKVLAQFLITAALSGIKSNVSTMGDSRLFTVSGLAEKLLKCVQVYDHKAFQHSVVQAIWQQVAGLTKCNKSDVFVESLNSLSSDTAEDRQPLEMMEHPTTGTSEEESSSLESLSDEEDPNLIGVSNTRDGSKALGSYREMWNLIEKVVEERKCKSSNVTIETTEVRQLQRIVQLMSLLPFEWLAETCLTSCFIGLISTDMMLHRMKWSKHHTSASSHCRSLMWTIIRGCLGMRRYTLHHVITFENLLVWLLQSTIAYWNSHHQDEADVDPNDSTFLQVSIGVISSAVNFTLHKPASCNAIHNNVFWQELSRGLESLVKSLKTVEKNYVTELLSNRVPLLLNCSGILAQVTEELTSKTVRHNVPTRCAELLRCVGPQVVHLVDILVDRTASDEEKSSYRTCHTSALCRVLGKMPAVIGSFAHVLHIFCMSQESRKLACLKEQLKGCRLQECLPAVLSSAFHFLQTLSHTTGSTQSPSNEEQATACSRVCDNRQEVFSSGECNRLFVEFFIFEVSESGKRTNVSRDCIMTSLQLVRVVCTFHSQLAGIPEGFHDLTLALLLHVLKELRNKPFGCYKQRNGKSAEHKTGTSSSVNEREMEPSSDTNSTGGEAGELVSEALLALFQSCSTDELPNLLLGLTNELRTQRINSNNSERLLTSVTVWSDLLSSRWAKRTRELRSHLPQVLVLLHCALQELRNSDRADLVCLILNVIVKILSLGKDIVLPHNATLVLQGSLLVDMKRTDESFARLFQCQFELLSTVLFQHSEAVYDTVHVFLSCVANLLKSLLSCCNERHACSETGNSDVLEGERDGKFTKQDMLLCAQKLARLYREIASHKTTFSKYSPYMVADYLHEVCSVQLRSTVKFNFDKKKLTLFFEQVMMNKRRFIKVLSEDALVDGVYCLLDLCGTHEMAQLHAVLEKASLERFRALLADYNKYHKFKGKV